VTSQTAHTQQQRPPNATGEITHIQGRSPWKICGTRSPSNNPWVCQHVASSQSYESTFQLSFSNQLSFHLV